MDNKSSYLIVLENGESSGQGINNANPLILTYSSIVDNQINIELKPTIQLNFSKNICNLLVLENNAKSIHLTDEDNNTIQIDLKFPDDQVQREYKTQIFITPTDSLRANTEYRLALDNTIQAKNGTDVDRAYTIKFTTGEQLINAQNGILTKLGDNVISFTENNPENDALKLNLTLNEGSQNLEQGFFESDVILSSYAPFIIVIIIIVFTLLFIKTRKN